MRILSFLLFCSLTIAEVSAQSIQWIEKDHDFGLMPEVAGPRTGHSRFVNTGSTPVSIIDVKPSCGCTSAEFTDEPIAPGDTAVISYTYDPTMRPGRFLKSVKVRLSDNSRHQIVIEGNVLGTPESLATLYPEDAGDMRLTESVVNLGQVKFGRSPIHFINAYSLASEPINPAMTSPSAHLTVSPSDSLANPGDVITYSIILDTRRMGKYGPVEIPLTFRSKPDAAPTVIPLRANVIPDKEYLLKRQGDKHPACTLSTKTVEIYNASDAKGNLSFQIINQGDAPLNILRIWADSKALDFDYNHKEIKPGKKSDVKISLRPEELPSSPGRITITVITDDPDRPLQTITAPISNI